MTINLHFIDYCNYDCKHCFVNKEKKELDFETIIVIVNKIYDYSIKCNKKIRINLAGGEPLLSKNIQKIIDYIHDKGLEVSMITNGSLLTEDFIIRNKDKLSMIGISIDSLEHDTNITIGRESCKKTIEIEKIKSLCKCIKATKMMLKINICISKLNYSENLCSFMDSIKPNKIKILRVLIDHNDSLKEIALLDNEWNKVIKKYEELPNVIFEDNDYMKESYIIIDSKGNLSKNNLHIACNSIIEKELVECLNQLNDVRRC